MAKKSKSKGGAAAAKAAQSKKEVEERHRTVSDAITMEALQEMSDDSDGSGELPPESEWNKDARDLKAAIERGTFNVLLSSSAAAADGDGDDDDAESFEEVDLDDDDDDDDDDDESVVEDEPATNISKTKQVEADYDDEDSAVASDDEEEASEDEADQEEADEEEEEEASEDESDQEDANDEEEVVQEVDEKKAIENDEESENGEEEKETLSIRAKNSVQAKALQVVIEGLVAEKKEWPWAETFSVIPATPLPFGAGTAEALNIHDDLKREVAFYDMALEAVLEAKEKCKNAGVPFSRPEDFFAEMVKTDEHMAKVKDRLIYETKKMEAVAQRKSNKEQKLRSKESHSNKLAEKAKKKKDHFKAVEEWAESAKANRGRGRLADSDAGEAFFNSKGGSSSSGGGDNKKRAYADKKFGHGGKRGRFKQNDPKALNDMSSFNRRGNFGGIGTKKASGSASSKKAGAGANRKGKRARDASRSR